MGAATPPPTTTHPPVRLEGHLKEFAPRADAAPGNSTTLTGQTELKAIQGSLGGGPYSGSAHHSSPAGGSGSPGAGKPAAAATKVLQGKVSTVAPRHSSYDEYIKLAARKAGVREEVVRFIFDRETGNTRLRDAAISSSGACGAMQLKGEICRNRSLGGNINPFDPAQSFLRAAALLKYFRTHPKFKNCHTNDPAVLVTLYNQGENYFKPCDGQVLDHGNAKTLKGKLRRQAWYYLYENGKHRKGLYEALPELKGMTRKERELWMMNHGGAAPAETAPPSAKIPTKTVPRRLLQGQVVHKTTPTAKTAPAQVTLKGEVSKQRGFLDGVGQWWKNNVVEPTQKLLKGAARINGNDIANAILMSPPALANTPKDAGTYFSKEQWDRSAPVDPKLVGELKLASRMPKGFRPDRLKELSAQDAYAVLDRAAGRGDSGIDVFSDKELMNPNSYFLSGKVVAELSKQFQLHLLNVPKGVTKDGRPYKLQGIVLGNGQVVSLYDLPEFRFHNKERKRDFLFKEPVVYTINGPGDLSVQNVWGYGKGLESLFNARILRMKKIGGFIHVDTDSFKKSPDEKVEPIEKLASGRETVRLPLPEAPGGRSPLRAPLAALALVSGAGLLGLAAERLSRTVRA